VRKVNIQNEIIPKGVVQKVSVVVSNCRSVHHTATRYEIAKFACNVDLRLIAVHQENRATAIVWQHAMEEIRSIDPKRKCHCPICGHRIEVPEIRS
jgi:hypothetical protein